MTRLTASDLNVSAEDNKGRGVMISRVTAGALRTNQRRERSLKRAGDIMYLATIVKTNSLSHCVVKELRSFQQQIISLRYD